ncbi:MAG TPA: hypothetical protein VGZ52_04065 [Acidimicrobiales bacterium]|nr:hypothetical protein [Acidimicrobiales bacterium]
MGTTPRALLFGRLGLDGGQTPELTPLPVAAAISFPRPHKKATPAVALDDDRVARVHAKVPAVCRHQHEPNAVAYDDVWSVLSERSNATPKAIRTLGQELLSGLFGKPLPYCLLFYMAELGGSLWVIRGNPELAQRFAPLLESTPDLRSEAVRSQR